RRPSPPPLNDPRRPNHVPKSEEARLLVHPRRHVELAALTLRDLPRHTDVSLLAQHVERDGLARVIGANDPHRLHRSGRLTSADRATHTPPSPGERRVLRRADHA